MKMMTGFPEFTYRYGYGATEKVAAKKATAIFFCSIWPYRLTRTVLAAVFLWSGGAKLTDPLSFAVMIEAYGLIPETWIMAVAVGLPALEVLAALGLLLDLRGSLGVISGLLILFMGLLGYSIWIGLDIDCGCFGPQDPESESYHSLGSALYKDFFMLTGVGYLYLWRFYRSAKTVRSTDTTE